MLCTKGTQACVKQVSINKIQNSLVKYNDGNLTLLKLCAFFVF